MSPRQRKHNKNLSREGDINYLEGGNPPIAAGLFNGQGVRLAWWPAGIEPTQENLERVVMELVWTNEHDKNGKIQAITREAILKFFTSKSEDEHGTGRQT